jgi:amino acid adenylation domain-containing protein
MNSPGANLKDIEDFYPLSPMQQGMWFHSLYAPESGEYLEQMICTLQGELDLPAFRHAWRQVVDRHPALRSAFVGEALKEPVQVVHRQVTLPLEEQDWRNLTPAEQEARLPEFLQADRNRGFKLSAAPLMRATVLRLAGDRRQFIWSFHHLLLDGWCIPILLDEVFAFYQAFVRNEELHLEPRRPYRDYIVWLKQQDQAAAEAFWREALQGVGAPAPLALPHGGEPGGYAEQEIRLSEAATTALESLARQHRLTLSTLVQGAWALLQSRYSGQPETVFGVTVSVRPPDLPGAEGMIGLFINTLPLRVRVAPGDALLPWLAGLQARAADLRQYAYSPLLQIQKWSELPSGQSLFDSILVVENYPVNRRNQALRAQAGAPQIGEVRFVERTNYPLTVIVGPDRELLLRILHDRRRFAAASIERMLAQLQQLLAAMVENPFRSLADLPWLTEAERAQIRVTWQGEPGAPEPRTISQLFEAQVERTPDAVALIAGDASLRYAELNRRANQIAHHLRRRGVGPETPVGVCLPRTPDLVAAILGVLKAGGAYVPLDPAYPAERLAFMLEDSGAAVLLTDLGAMGQMREMGVMGVMSPSPIQLIFLDRDWPQIAEEPNTNPNCAGDPANLAYVIYTSGSTGKPKGVAVEHRNATAYLHWAATVFTPEDRAGALFATSICFDLSVFEMFLPLTRGGTVMLAENALRVSELPAAARVAWINTVPSAITELLRLGGVPASVRTVSLGAEPLSTQLVEQIYRDTQVERVFDLYGPSETTVYCTSALRGGGGPATIGRPIIGAQVYLADSQMQWVPVGAPGEVYIGGEGLARGYYARPELTAERFIPNPYSETPGARLYKTGDLARYLPDGRIEYLGRLDRQVKVRGFRVELDEIEMALREHPSVREAAVILSTGADARLAAYVVAHGAAVPAVSELREFLKSKLPEYMTPSAFVLLDGLPLTANGKVDRRALPPLDPARPEVEAPFVAPRTPAEQLLAAVWADVLGLEQIGVHDNFFELGGDSILGIQMVARARQRGAELTPQQLFQHPTIAELAIAGEATESDSGFAGERAAEEKQESDSRAAVSLAALSAEKRAWLEREYAHIEDLYPLSPMQEGMLFHSLYEPAVGMYVGQTACEVERPDVGVMRRAWQQVLDRHPILRTAFVWKNLDRPLQVVCGGVALPFAEEDWREPNAPNGADEDARLAGWLEADRRRGFDLERAPLLRLTLLHGPADVCHLVCTSHHLLLDGWSLSLLLKEALMAYDALRAGQAPPAVHSRPYRDYIEWLSRQDRSRAEAFWRRELAGFRGPTRGPGPLRLAGTEDATNGSAPEEGVWLSEELTAGLQSFARKRQLTLNTLLQGAWAVLQSYYSGADEVVFGATVSGRPADLPGVETMIGLLINTLPVRVRVAPGEPLAPWLAALQRRQAELRQYAYSSLNDIQQWSDAPADRPLFDSILVFENYPSEVARYLQADGRELRILRSGRADTFIRTHSPLTLRVVPGERLALRVLQDANRFDAPTLLRHLELVLRTMAAQPDLRLAPLLDLLAEADQQAFQESSRQKLKAVKRKVWE